MSDNPDQNNTFFLNSHFICNLYQYIQPKKEKKAKNYIYSCVYTSKYFLWWWWWWWHVGKQTSH
jgi:hypothetical protein